MAATVASKRLLQEYKNLTNDPPDGITAGPVSEDDLFLWEALIQGPEGTPFEGGIFPAELKFPKDYPLAPPTMRFTCEMWHPNGESNQSTGSEGIRKELRKRKKARTRS
jgi:ubiquitin-conjugating enzyme E2 G2